MRARVRTDDGEQSEWFDVTQGLWQGRVLSLLLFNVFFATSIHAVLVRFSEDPDILRDLVHIEEDLGEDGVEVELLACVRRSVWGMMYADNAGIVSKSWEDLAKTMAVIVIIHEAAGLTVRRKQKRGQCCCAHSTRCPRHHRSSSKQRARGTCRQCSFCTWAVSSMHTPISCQRSKRRIRLAWACYDCFEPELHAFEDAPIILKVRLLKTVVMEDSALRCVTWALGLEHFANSERHTTTYSQGSLAFSADRAPTTSCRRQDSQEGTM